MANQHQYNIGVVITANGAPAIAGIQKVDSAVNRLGTTAKNALSSFVGNVGANAFSYLSGAATDAGKELLRYSANIETTRVAFESLSGSAAFATQHIKDLQKFSIENAMPFENLLTMSQRLQAGGIQGDKLMGVLKDIGNVAAATGKLSTERLEGIAIALSQISSKGRLSAEEMEQLAERGIPAWRMLSEATGLSVEKLRELGEKGVLQAEDLFDALNRAANTKFGDAMKKQSETGAGAMIGLKNAVEVTAAKAFEPLYKEFAQISVKAMKEINAQGGDLEAVGNVIMKYIGIGAGKATGTIGAAIGKQLGQSIAYAAGYSNQPDVLSDLLNNLERGFEEGFWKPILGDDWFEREWGNKVAKPIKNTQTATMQIWKDTGATVKKLPDASRILNAEKAEKEAERLKKQYETLVGTVKDLSLQVIFFGDETEVAATKQKLISAGITDMNSSLAKTALLWAGRLDQLKEGKKLQDEYNDKLKSAREELTDIRKDAEFKLRFADASELDQFNDQLRRGKFNFLALKNEVNATRLALQNLAIFTAADKRQTTLDSFFSTVNDFYDSLQPERVQTFADAVKDLFDNFGIDKAVYYDGDPMGMNAKKFGEAISKIMDAWKKAVREAPESDVEGISRAYIEQFSKYLEQFKIKAGEGFVDMFPKDLRESGKFVDALRTINNALVAKDIREGDATLDEILERVGLAATTYKRDIAELNQTLADERVKDAILRRAAALGVEASTLERNIILRRQLQEMPLALPEERLQRQRELPKGVDGGAWGNFKDGLFGSSRIDRAKSEADILKETYRDLGQTVESVFGSMTAAAADSLSAYIMTGQMGGQAFKQLTAQIISGLAVESGVKSIFQVAEGWAASARYDYVSAAQHFTSAKVYGAVALGSLGVGLGIGAAGGLNGRKGDSQANSPDYQTVSSYSSTTTQSYYVQQPQMSNLNKSIAGLNQTVAGLEQKIGSMKAGEVLTVGAKQEKGFISQTTIKELKSNSTTKTEMGKTLGLN